MKPRYIPANVCQTCHTLHEWHDQAIECARSHGTSGAVDYYPSKETA